MEEGERRWYEERIEVTRLERRLNFTKTCTSVRVEDGVSRPLERRACVGTIYPEIVGRNGVQGRANFRQFTRLTFVQIKFPMYIYIYIKSSTRYIHWPCSTLRGYPLARNHD